MKNIKWDKFENKLSFVFKILFLIYLFLQTIVVFHRTLWVGVALWLMLVIGAFVCVFKALRIREFLKTKGIIWLLLFLLSYFISIVVNREYGIREDMANLVIMGLAICVIYVPEIGAERKQFQKEIQIISRIFIAIMNVSIIVSLVMLMVGYGDVWYYADYDYILKIGIIENRLWGVFSNPNLAAEFAIISMGLCLYLWSITKKKWYYILTIMLDILYIAFSDSRSGKLSLFLMTLFVSFMLLKRFARHYKKKVFSLVIYAVVSIIIAGVVAEVPTQIQKTYNCIVEKAEDDESKEESIVIKRDYDLSQDVTNKRLDIWISGIEIFVSKPITGVGFHHLKDYAKQELPNTYLASGDFCHTHNELLNILVSQGILGIIPFVIFAITSLICIFRKYIRLQNDDYREFTIFIGCLISICSCILLNEGILYCYVPSALFFWMLLGYLRNVRID